jgi:four helix bundle protein
MAVNSDPSCDVPTSPQQLADRLIDFAVRIGRLVDELPDTRLGPHIAGQLVRSGTSPAPNYGEACAAESPRDFVHKLGICLKELRKSHCWLAIIARGQLMPGNTTAVVCDECNQLAKILAESIITAKRRSMHR